MNQPVDAIVIGLGGIGAAAVYQLAARGANVIGFDQFEPAHSHGSSHGASRIIRQAYYEHPGYLSLLLRAYELWRELEHDSGDNYLLQITGGLYLGAPDSSTVRGSLQSAVQYLALAGKTLIQLTFFHLGVFHQDFPLFFGVTSE
jgi:sarcosine oxidase